MSKILENLNPAQKEAVTWPNTPLLILAGAGSGKTRILTRRIAYLISQGVPSFHILGVTFTNKAASEMKFRVQQLVSQDVWVSTFHSTCMRMLRMDGPAIGLDRNFAIYDDHDQLVLIKECIKELNLDEKRVHPKGVREQISRAKDSLLTPFQFTEKSNDLYEEAVGKVYSLYEEKLKKLKACDFGDLIMKTVLMLDRHPEVLRSWQDRFHHVLIDEYQDTNHAQYRFVKLLAQSKRHITVVGDPDQSIYAWRGADIRNILSFEKDYLDCGIIKMEQNYRSTQTILDAANELIKRNQMRKPKDLWTERGEGEKIRLFEARDERHEAQYVVDSVLKEVESGRTLSEQVVFYRVHAQSRILEDTLMRHRIPYKIIGGTRFYDRMEIKDLLAYLRYIAFPHDELSLKRIINVPARGIGKKALETIEDYAKVKQISFHDALRNAGHIDGLMPRVKKSVLDFYGFVEHLRKKESEHSLRELVEMILDRSGYVRALEEERTTEAQARIENLEEFFSVVQEWSDLSESPESLSQDAPQERSMLERFLESITLATDLDQYDSGTNILTLMTLHTAKGLEFPVVYMMGMEEGIFPNINAFTDNREDLEEERRLCYVGITRSKEKLHLIYARQRQLYGSRQFNLPSRFLGEIPPQLLQSYASRAWHEEPDLDRINDADLDIDIDPDDIKRRILFD